MEQIYKTHATMYQYCVLISRIREKNCRNFRNYKT